MDADPNGGKATQLRLIRLTNQAPSQCVKASHSDYLEKGLAKGKSTFSESVFIRVHPWSRSSPCGRLARMSSDPGRFGVGKGRGAFACVAGGAPDILPL
jgi:hypothetical protein